MTGQQPPYLKLEEVGSLPPLALAIGVFDGVHRGHQTLLAAAQEEAQATDSTPAALTFDPHPAVVFAPSRVPLLLSSLKDRAMLLHRYGADEVLVVHFDRAFAALMPEEFIRSVLMERLHVRAVIVGDDFRFGCDRKGDVAYLQKAGERYGFAVRSIAPVFVNGVPARSTAIRQMLMGGQVEEAARLLGRPYALAGQVVQGRRLGRTLGYPTANLATAPGILVPAAAIYAGHALLESGERIPAAISIGTNPTVTPESVAATVEAYLMGGFDRDLYGQRLSVEFVSYLRPTMKFDSLQALVQQMGRDVSDAAKLLK
jgi:riboflavin kinase/FMN adenylyltransferase